MNFDQLPLFVVFITVVWIVWKLVFVNGKLKSIDDQLNVLQTEDSTEKATSKQLHYLSRQQAHLIMQMVRRYMETEKPYLDPGFKMSKMCDALKVNRTYLSEVLKKETGERFENFVNAYRIVYAIELLTTDTHEKWLFTLDHYARKAGFSSKSTFNRAFKQFTDLHPSFLQRVFLEDEVAVKWFLGCFERLGVVLHDELTELLESENNLSNIL